MSTIVLYPANGYDYDAADVAAYNAPRTSGVYSSDEDFVVAAAGGMDVTVSAGIGWVRPERFAGYSIVKREADTLTLPLADGTRSRIDRIILRYDAASRKASLQVLTGDPASTPTAPAISRTALVYDLCLAEITRPAGSTSITAANITDTRLDETLCGVMSDGVTGIPTDALLAEARARIGEIEQAASDSAAEADKSAKAAASSERAAKTAADTATTQATEAKGSAEKAAQSESNAKASKEEAVKKAGEARTSASEAAKSQQDAAASKEAAATSEANAKKYSEEAGAKAGTDKTFTVEDAPADAKATGEALAKKADTNHAHDLSAMINGLDAGTSTPTDADYYVCQYAGGGTSNTSFVRRTMSALWAYIKAKTDKLYSASGHTHSYAGSGSAGGSATSAVKLDTSTAGSATQPVYFTGGKPAACTYSLGKSVPSNAVFTDTTYGAATQSAAGLMSAADKKKLDSNSVVSQTSDPGAGSSLATGTILLVYT